MDRWRWRWPSSPGRQTSPVLHVRRTRACSIPMFRLRVSATRPTVRASGPWRRHVSRVPPVVRVGRGRLVSVLSGSSGLPRPPPAWPGPCAPGVGAPPRRRVSGRRHREARTPNPPVHVRLDAPERNDEAGRRSTEGGGDDESDVFRCGLRPPGPRPWVVRSALPPQLEDRPAHLDAADDRTLGRPPRPAFRRPRGRVLGWRPKALEVSVSVRPCAPRTRWTTHRRACRLVWLPPRRPRARWHPVTPRAGPRHGAVASTPGPPVSWAFKTGPLTCGYPAHPMTTPPHYKGRHKP